MRQTKIFQKINYSIKKLTKNWLYSIDLMYKFCLTNITYVDNSEKALRQMQRKEVLQKALGIAIALVVIYSFFLVLSSNPSSISTADRDQYRDPYLYGN